MTGQTRRNLFAAAALTGAWAVAKTARAAGWWDDDDDDRTHHHHHERGERRKDQHCFLHGTLVATPEGEQPIETILPGNEVSTWLGPSSVVRHIISYRSSTPPIRIVAGALAPGIPRRDLIVSQHHAVVVDDILIEAGCLINGRTILRQAAAPGAEYFHIRLDRHDVIIAEGAPCETLRWAGEVACLPLSTYGYTRGAVRSHLRSALAPWVDVRTPVDVARDRLAV